MSRGIYSQHEIKITKLFDKRYNTVDSNITNPSFISEKANPDEKKNILKVLFIYKNTYIYYIYYFISNFYYINFKIENYYRVQLNI